MSARHHALIPDVLLRGMLMGAADIVPGVSGGTIAFITGIYARLLAAISACDLSALRSVLAGRWREAWEHVDGGFLLTLVAGIGLSVFSLARGIGYLLDTRPLLVWAFFFGLILASGLILLRHVEGWNARRVACLLAAFATALAIALAPAMALPVILPSFFLAGFVAICAMILPGISGSFILLLLGMYPAVLDAIKSLDLLPLALFAAGAGSGLLAFSRVLHWLLEHRHAAVMATLTGFLFGSLLVVWPWKLAVEMEGPGRAVSPLTYGDSVGDPMLLHCLGLMLLGFIAVWLLESRWGGPER